MERNCGVMIPIFVVRLRKVLPLRAKLTELKCWITGLRRQQSQTRADIGILEVYTRDDSQERSSS